MNIAANISGKMSLSSGLSFNGRLPSFLLQKNDDSEIDVDFGADLPPGQFCYTICVYDEQGNIRQPEEVCVTVESWGGMDEMDGTWAFVVDNNRLSIVEYYFRGTINGELDEEFTLEAGDARLVLDGTITLEGNSFLITEARDGVDEVRRYYF